MFILSSFGFRRLQCPFAAVPGRAKHPRDFSQADKLVPDITTGQVENRPPRPEEQGKDSAAVRRGQLGGAKGGRSGAAALPEQQCKEIAKKSVRINIDYAANAAPVAVYRNEPLP
jgi:hypothetical protein